MFCRYKRPILGQCVVFTVIKAHLQEVLLRSDLWDIVVKARQSSAALISIK